MLLLFYRTPVKSCKTGILNCSLQILMVADTYNPHHTRTFPSTRPGRVSTADPDGIPKPAEFWNSLWNSEELCISICCQSRNTHKVMLNCGQSSHVTLMATLGLTARQEFKYCVIGDSVFYSFTRVNTAELVTNLNWQPIWQNVLGMFMYKSKSPQYELSFRSQWVRPSEYSLAR